MRFRRPYFPALEWLANLCSHIPNRGEQMVRYYGFFNTIRDYSSSGNHHFNYDLKSVDLNEREVRKNRMINFLDFKSVSR